MKKGRKLLAVLKYVLLIGIAAVAVYYWQQGMEQKEAEVVVREPIPAPVRVSAPLRGNLEKVFTLPGFIESESMVTVLPMVSGILTELYPEVGDALEKGDPIGVIDDEVFQLQTQQAETAYLASKSTYERMAALYQAGATSEQNYSQTRSQYEAYKSQYDLSMLQLNYTRLEAPVSGIVLVKHTEAGSLVAPQVPVVTIGDLENLVIRANVPEQYYETFLANRNSMEIRITRPEYPDAFYSAEVENLSPFISAESRSFQVTCRIAGDTSSLRPGMYVSCSFVLETRPDAAYLPLDSLSSTGTIWYMDEENTARVLRLPALYETDEYFIVPEDYVDYRFIVEGQFFLVEGQKVAPVEVPSGEDSDEETT